MSDNEAVIKISNLVKEYKMYSNKKDRLLEAVLPGYKKHTTFRAMNNLNLEIKKGEVLGILGKNGAGKSTLLKMITGVVIPTSGNLEVKGKISSLLELGAAFNPDLTGYENIYQHGQVMGLSDEEIKSKEQEIIDFADIGEHLSQPVKTYSSGMFARLAFKKFEQFKNNGKTIIFVTHNINDVMTNCNRVIILENGTKTFDGSVKDGVNRYKKIIVGLNPDEENKVEEETQELETENIKDEANSTFENFWKDQMNQNPNMIEYGNKLAEVIDYGVFDKDGNLVNMFDNGDYITFKSKVKFNKEVKEPIFTVTLKDFSGKDITGTNTNIEKIATGTFKKGEIAVVEFTQKIPVAPGKYTLSFSCTRYNAKGDLEALNRKYDALLIEIIATKNTVGLIRLDSKINIKKL